jgi:photosystem II stability/assembly factor-like uncharacterized protein
MLPKRLIALTLFAALAVIPTCVLRAQWVQTNGIYGGMVGSMGTNGRELFVNIEDVGVFRSTNGGMTWTDTNNGLPSNPFSGYILGSSGGKVYTISIYDSNVYIWSEDSSCWIKKGRVLEPANVTLLGGDGTFLLVGTDLGIQGSSDQGETWTVLTDTLLGHLGTYVTGFAVIDSFLFAGTENSGILRSSDNGDHWSWFDTTLLSFDVKCLMASGKNLFSGSNTGVLLSTDYGMSWDSVCQGLLDTEVDGLAVLGTTIIAGTRSGIYTSTNYGSSWQAESRGIPQIGISTLTLIGDTLFAGTNYYGVFRSIDTGHTWALAGNGLVPAPVSTLLAQGSLLYAGGSGLYQSADEGMDWKILESKAGKDSIYDFSNVIALALQGSNIYALSDGLFLSSDSGSTWELRENGLPSASLQCLCVKGSKLFAGTYLHGVFLSTDSGASWSDANYGLPLNSWVTSLCIVGNDIVAATDNEWGAPSGVYVSSDEGETWASHDCPYSYIDLVGVIDTLVFAATTYGSIYRSSINDTAWTLLSLPAKNVTSFAAIDTTLFAGTQKGLFASYDNGDNWVEVDSGITYPYILSLAISDSMLFAGTLTNGTIYSSMPTVWRRPLSQLSTSPYTLGASVDTINFGSIQVGKDSFRIDTLSNNGKDALTIRSFQLTQSKNAFVASDLSSEVELNPGESFTFEAYFTPTKPGIYSANLAVVSEAKIVNLTFIGTATGTAGISQQSQSDSRQSVFPNPFSQSTQITFSPESAGYADISIVNLLGEQVASIFSGELDAGQHNFTFSNTEGLPDGTYECRIRMNGQVETLPVVKLSEP